MTVTPLVKEVAIDLHARGWSPLPLPPRAKSQPPTGYTGYRGRYPSRVEIDAWSWDGNIALRLAPDVVGVDVDVYHGGRSGLDELMDRYGVLPATAWSTSREDGSGIGLFRVPVGTTLATDPAQGIDMIQAHHRYMVVWPSIHPEGRLYQWIDDYGNPLDGPPDVDDLPELPWAWVEGLAVAKGDAIRAATPGEVEAFMHAHTEHDRPYAIKGIRKRLETYVGARHDTLVEVACWATREAAAGYYPAGNAIDELWRWWCRVMDDPNRRDGGEFGAAVMWAVAQAGNDPERITALRNAPKSRTDNPQPPPDVDPETGEKRAEPSSWKNLPPAFWNSRDSLAHIRQAAHSRARSADAVLICTLARIATLTPPTVTLPPIVGGAASLNMLGAIIATSGAGKSSANAVARELVPIDRKDIVADQPLGSGEGLTERYFDLVEETDDNGKKRKVKRQVRTAAMFYLDEGQALAEMGNRSGATLLPTLRAAWSGETIGQSNAAVETHRVLKDHSYRMAIIVGFQVAYAANMLADAEGGTPQRFVYASAVDPAVPFDAPEWPGRLPYDPPPIIRNGAHIDVDPDIADGIRRRQVMMQRGEYVPEALDSHAELGRLKLAALLGLLEGRQSVEEDDWALAGQIMRASTAVRTWVLEEAHQKARQAEEGRIASRIRMDAALEDDATRRALLAGARAIGRRAHKAGGKPIAKRDLMAAVDSKNRKLVAVDEMLTYAIEHGWVAPDGDQWQAGESQPA